MEKIFKVKIDPWETPFSLYRNLNKYLILDFYLSYILSSYTKLLWLKILNALESAVRCLILY